LKKTPFFPPSGPANGSFNGHHPKSKFLAVEAREGKRNFKDWERPKMTQ